MVDETLSLRPSWPDRPDDYVVCMEGESIGRIRAQTRGLPGWPWVWEISLTLPVGRSDLNGGAETFEEAKAAWKAKWAELRPTITDEWLADQLRRLRETTARMEAWAATNGPKVWA